MTGLSIKNAIAPSLFLCALGYIVFRCLGCTPAEANAMALSAENALAVKQYDDELVACQQAARQKPKDQRFEAYADCEQRVSKEFCDASESLREHWPRCKELDR